ncbi:MAG: acylphosphatase [Solobacterium sp.]|nr:acylphosphatase [Solobacterium sp.]
MKRYYAIVEGRVQGVGFCSFCIQTAREFGLTGSVRNLSNGMVEIYVQGEALKIDAFFAVLKQGDFLIRVDNISQKEVPIEPREKSFVCNYDSSWY